MRSVLVFTLLTISSNFLITLGAKTDTVRICASANENYKMSRVVKYCDLLAKSKKTRVTCVYGTDRLDCLRMVSDRKADFTILQAEDLLFAKKWKGSAVLIVSEVRGLKTEAYEYKAVVVVRNNVTVAADLRGAKLCHPGWGLQPEKNVMFTQYLEERLVPQECKANMSLNEDRIRSSALHFGPTCKVGQWSQDKEEDSALKSEYANLCKLCDDPLKCSNPDKYGGVGGAATCIRDGVGDVLWATYKDVHLFFKLPLSTDTPNEVSKQFSFMCEDGTFQPLNTTDPCHWLARPWPVVAANIKAATDVQKTLELLRDSTSNDWEENLINVIETYTEYIINMAAGKTPEDYLETIPGYMGASEMNQAHCMPTHEVVWCTYNNADFRKCDWLAAAATVSGVDPAIRCLQKPTLTDCFELVRSEEADVVVVKPDYQPIAMLQYDLVAVFYENFKNQALAYNLAALVKRESRFKKMSDLRSQRACFTLHDGFAWRSVLIELRDNNLVSESCGSSGLIEGFFKSVCVTGDGYDDSKFSRCCPESVVETDPDTSAFHCLASGGCDVAFVQSSTLTTNTDGNNTASWAEHLRSDDYRPVCNNDKQGACSISWAHAGAVMTAANLSDWKLSEIRRVFSQLSQRFTRKEKENDIMFSMFGKFQEESNSLFQDTSTGLIPTDRVHRNSRFMEEIVMKTKYCSSSWRNNSSLLVIFIWVFILSILTGS